MPRKLLNRDDLLAVPAVPPSHRVSYGPHDDQVVDVYLPDSKGPAGAGPYPVVLLLHGGCWRASVGRTYFGQFARALGEHGFAAWNVEYRRIGAGGGWPATFLDVAAAADLLAASADTYGLDLERVVAVGHSAGGHLASWLAARPHLPEGAPGADPEPLRLRGVLSLAGMPDLAEAHARGICMGAVAELLGDEPTVVPEILALASPAELPPTDAPQVHLVGALDTVVPPAYVEASVTRMQSRGQSARLQVLPESGHMEPVIAAAPPWADVLGAITALAAGRMSATRATEPSPATPRPDRPEKGTSS